MNPIIKINYFFIFVMFTQLSFACDFKTGNTTDLNLLNKIKSQNIPPSIGCSSLKTAMFKHSNRTKVGGRRLEDDTPGQTSIKNLRNTICSDNEQRKKIAEINDIQDVSVRSILLAAVLDEFEDYSARDIVLANPTVKLCL